MILTLMRISIYKLPCRISFPNMRRRLQQAILMAMVLMILVIGGNAFDPAQVVFTTTRWKVFTEEALFAR